MKKKIIVCILLSLLVGCGLEKSQEQEPINEINMLNYLGEEVLSINDSPFFDANENQIIYIDISSRLLRRVKDKKNTIISYSPVLGAQLIGSDLFYISKNEDEYYLYLYDLKIDKNIQLKELPDVEKFVFGSYYLIISNQIEIFSNYYVDADRFCNFDNLKQSCISDVYVKGVAASRNEIVFETYLGVSIFDHNNELKDIIEGAISRIKIWNDKLYYLEETAEGKFSLAGYDLVSAKKEYYVEDESIFDYDIWDNYIVWSSNVTGLHLLDSEGNSSLLSDKPTGRVSFIEDVYCVQLEFDRAFINQYNLQGELTSISSIEKSGADFQ